MSSVQQKKLIKNIDTIYIVQVQFLLWNDMLFIFILLKIYQIINNGFYCISDEIKFLLQLFFDPKILLQYLFFIIF